MSSPVYTLLCMSLDLWLSVAPRVSFFEPMNAPRRPSVPKNQCYWYGCDASATTDDHVPPRAFFFEGTDVQGVDEEELKRNRLTVRSCLEHNRGFSDDEEYVAVIAYMVIENHPLAHRHAMGKQFETLSTKVNEKLGRRLGASFREPARTFLTSEGPAPGFRVDMLAVKRVGEKIARGLHYRLTGERLQGTVDVWAPNFGGGSPRMKEHLRGRQAAFDAVPFTSAGVSGHPLVFEYAHRSDVMRRYVSMKFRFFQGFELRALAVSPWMTAFDDRPVNWPYA